MSIAVRHLATLIEADLDAQEMYLTEAEYHATVTQAFRLLDQIESFLGVDSALFLAEGLHARLVGPDYAKAVVRKHEAHRRLARLRSGDST